MITSKQRYLYYLAWTVAMVAMVASLYYSEIRHFLPCVLCWYQRICNYPIVAIGLVGILANDKNLPKYILPLSVIGLGIAGYHSLLQAGIIPEQLAPCVNGVSCLTKHNVILGLTIPMFSFLAFLLITIAMVLALRQNGAKHE